MENNAKNSLIVRISLVGIALVIVGSIVLVPLLVSATENIEGCEFEGHKYALVDNIAQPLAGWDIGLSKAIFDADETVSTTTEMHDIVSTTTDADGYFCIEWDTQSNLPDYEQGKSFAFYIYEVMQTGWEFVSAEKGIDHLTLEVVTLEDLVIDTDRIAAKVSETNGYVLTNAEYHVDFYNQRIAQVTTPPTSGVLGASFSSRSGSRRATTDEVATSTEIEMSPEVLGVQTDIVPVGAANAGAGGSQTATVATWELMFLLLVGALMARKIGSIA
jgi:hypothetical protein